MAILDQIVNPHWPHLPKRKESYENEEEKEGIEGAWNTITDDPLEYHFFIISWMVMREDGPQRLWPQGGKRR